MIILIFSMKIPKLVVFDLAGTTVYDNKDVHRCLQKAMKEINVNITIEEANSVMGIPKPVAIEKLLTDHHYPFISPGLILEIHKNFVEDMKSFYQRDASVRENPGVSDTFRVLKAHGVRIVVDTGFDRVITNPLLDRMEWSKKGLIDGSVTSDEVSNGRPAPDMIFRAMWMTDVKAVKEVAKVGDTASDILEGKSAGCGWVVGITSGAYSREDLSKLEPTHLISAIPELLPLFGL